MSKIYSFPEARAQAEQMLMTAAGKPMAEIIDLVADAIVDAWEAGFEAGEASK